MIIKEIYLENFRNYEKQILNLEKGINIIYGNNAQGKTNLLEAIFLCSIGKSFRTNKDNCLINFNFDNTKIKISYNKSDRDGNISLELGDKKRFLLNDIPLKRTSEVLGNIFVVLFTPDDISILKEGPAHRRRFLDIMISQLRPNYMRMLTLYKQTMEQRNSYLRSIKLENKSQVMLDVWDEKLSELGKKIYDYRCEFVKKISDKLGIIHSNITNSKENISIEYCSHLSKKQTFLEQLKNSRDIDILRGTTSIGIHKDDFRIKINDKIIDIYGSQGQHRTAILSLKIAELEIIEEEVGEYPILLLDDFMSELDEIRRVNLLKNMKNNQVIITCTDKTFFEDIDATFFKVENGKINFDFKKDL